MFVAVLMILLTGSPPSAYASKEEFVSREACEVWAANDAKRVQGIVDEMPEDQRPRWEIRCVPKPGRDAQYPL